MRLSFKKKRIAIAFMATVTAFAPNLSSFYGDSNTVGYPSLTFQSGIESGVSYVSYLNDDLLLDIDGSNVVNGQTTSQVRATATPIPGHTAFWMLGTNDLRTGIPLRTSMQETERWWKVSQPDAFMVMAIPPYTGKNAQVTAYNVALKKLAAKWGWEYGDPWRTFRTADGGWVPGSNADAKHGTPEALAVVGAKLDAKMTGWILDEQ